VRGSDTYVFVQLRYYWLGFRCSLFSLEVESRSRYCYFREV